MNEKKGARGGGGGGGEGGRGGEREGERERERERVDRECVLFVFILFASSYVVGCLAVFFLHSSLLVTAVT